MKRGDAFVYTDFPMETGTKSPLLVFQRCDRQARTEYRIDTTRPDESRITNPTPEFEEPRCPFYTIDDSQTLWTVVIDQGTILVRVAATFPASGDQPKRVEEHAFALQVVDRPYALHWSAGFTFNTVRDEEYRLDPDSSDDTKLKLIRNGSGSVPYQLGAFAHYTKLSKRRDSTRSLSASFGIGTKVPVNELTAMLGATYSLRTLPVVNAGHLTVGMAYAPHKTLISDYRGLGTVPAGTSSASLTASRYGFGVFVAVTFSFLGGEEQFRGVYSGKGSTKDDK